MARSDHLIVDGEGHVLTTEVSITYDLCGVCGRFATHTLSLGDDQILDCCFTHLLERLSQIEEHWRDIARNGLPEEK